MGIKFNTNTNDDGTLQSGTGYSPDMAYSETDRNHTDKYSQNGAGAYRPGGGNYQDSVRQGSAQNYPYEQDDTLSFSYEQNSNPNYSYDINWNQNASFDQNRNQNASYDQNRNQRASYNQDFAQNSFHNRPNPAVPGSPGKIRKRRKILLPVLIAFASILVLVGIFFIAKKILRGSESDVEGSGTTSYAESNVPVGGEGRVLNISVWNEEFINRVADHYPNYKRVSDTEGKIGDVTVKWNITANQDNAYQYKLDEDLAAQASAAADDKIDLFLVEADYALKYVDADANAAMPLKDLGITDADLSKQFKYTRDVVTDADGVIRGSSWQACSAGMIYRRDVAQEVFGVSEPADVQKLFKDWDAYKAAAAKLKEKGYHVTSSVYDTYRVYSNNVSGPWVQDGQVVVDAGIRKWVDDSMELVKADETGTFDLWSNDWAKSFFKDGKAFAYFGPAWLINFSMHADEDGSVGKDGGWALTTGPQGFYWGGTWICAAQGTDNPTLVKDIILTMTTDDAVMKDIAVKDSDCVNNKDVLKDLASDTSFGNAILGGQNPYEMLAAGAELVDMKNISTYDQGCNEEFQKAMKNYFEGSAASYEDALAEFGKNITVKYPELTLAPEIQDDSRNDIPAGPEGDVLNIAVWNEEFMNRMEEHYPDYVKISDTEGMIDNIKVNWIVTTTMDNGYINYLDEALAEQAGAAADRKIDLFLVETESAQKYVNAAMPLKDLGITDADLSKQFKYTRDVVTDANGVIRGSSWQACSGGMIYRRDIAQEVFGTSEPADIQELFKDWSSYKAAAAALKAKGYHVTTSAYDTYRVYSCNKSVPWVQDGKIVVDDNIRKWTEDSMELIRNGETSVIDLWSDEWSKGFYMNSNVFAYFGPLWFINFTMHDYDDGSVATAGGWALTAGPQSFYWGGTWICAAQGTDNPTLVKDIILTMTTDDAVMKDIAVKDSDCVNNKKVLKDLASGNSYGNAILGGQNPYGVLSDSAENIDMSNICDYDQGCSEEYQLAMHSYFLGSTASYEDALADFRQGAKVRYPELS